MLGISVNKPEANRSFAQRLGLTFPLLCDTEKKVSRLYGMLSILHVAKRATFVIDAERIIRHIDLGREAMVPARALQACNLLAPNPC
ncbi:MAG: redoxin domain-containing protein [Acidobacteria bacterium]|nr:MAG: redoxin domain-containing protein [Acidobacteriota bacterium]